MGTQLNLNTQTVGDIKIALPPADEIEEIVAYLDVKLAEFDALKAHVDTELELLKELRSSTITDAVLGRIDIRGIKTH
jgi:type I restriction enzyme S subunit